MPREYDKLVRDRIPALVREDGETPVTHVAADEEYGDRLLDKLDEEVGEFRASGDPEELADVLAVIHAIREFRGLSEGDLRELRRDKAERRGRFEDRLVLERVRP